MPNLSEVYKSGLNTHFKYKERVEITEGFYRTSVGHILDVSFRPHSEYGRPTAPVEVYLVQLDDTCQWFPSTVLKPVRAPCPVMDDTKITNMWDPKHPLE